MAGTEHSIETRTSWVMAAAVLAILSVSFGAPILVVVALRPIAEDLAGIGGGGRAIPALASSLAYLGSGLGGMLMGWVASRLGVRASTATGGAALGLGLALAAGGASWQLLLGYGLFVGVLGNGALYPPLMTYVSLWFDRRRGTALALVSSGQYVAGGIWPSLLERLVAEYGWQRTMLGFGLFAACWILPIALFVLRPPPVAALRSGPAAGPAEGAAVLRMPPNLALALLAAASFICCIPMAMPAAHLVAFCGDLGIGSATGAAMLSLLLGCAFVARQAWGALSDRIGGLNTVIAGNLCQTLGMALFLMTQDEAGLFLVSALYGLGFGGIVPAYVLAVRELFPVRDAAWRVPALLFCSLSGMAAGAWLAGALYDTSGSYALAWEVGVISNLAALALLLWLASRREGGLRHRPAMAA